MLINPKLKKSITRMFVHLLHHQIDKKKWDDCIYESREGIIYAFSWYLDVVAPNWEALVLFDKKENYRAVMPLPVRRKYGIKYIEQPLFAQQLGVFAVHKLSENEFECFIDFFQRRFKLISNYPFNVQNYDDFGGFISNGELKVHSTHHIDLNQSYQMVKRGYYRFTKNKLNKLKGEYYRVAESSNIDLLWEMFQDTVSQKIEGGVNPEAISKLLLLFEKLTKRNLVKLTYVYDENSSLLSGSLIIKSLTNFQVKWIYLFNASSSKPNESRRWFVNDFFKKKSNDNKLSLSYKENIFDFESMQNDSMNTFYKSFGSKEKSFLVYSQNKLPVIVKFTQKIVQFFKK